MRTFLSYEESLSSKEMFRPTTSYSSASAGAFERLASLMARPGKYKFANGSYGYHTDGSRGNAARPSPLFTISERERFAVRWIGENRNRCPEPLRAEMTKALDVATKAGITVPETKAVPMPKVADAEPVITYIPRKRF